MKKVPIKELLILTLIIIGVWLPVCFGKYSYSMAIIITLSALIGGYIGKIIAKKFFKKRK